MKRITSYFKSRDKPQNRTVGSAYTFYMGGTTSGKAVTERSAMQMTAVYSCVRILAEAVAGLPLHLYKYTDSASKEKALDHLLYHLLHDEPKRYYRKATAHRSFLLTSSMKSMPKPYRLKDCQKTSEA